jgi:multiple sugar transport system substrate-binding protein
MSMAGAVRTRSTSDATRISRRDFLRLSAVGGGAVLLAACQPAPAPAPTAAPKAEAKPTDAPKPAAAASPAGSPTPAPAAKPAASPAASPATSPAASPAAAAFKPVAINEGDMTRAQLLDGLRRFGGTKLTASLIGSSLPPKELLDEARQTGVELEITPTPATQLFEKLIVEFAGGSSSFDLVSYVVNDVGAFSQFMLDLKDLNGKYGWPEPNVMGAFRQYGFYPDRQSGAMYGLPYDGDLFLLHYRTDAFQAAGLDPAKPPATYDEMAQMAARLHDLEVGGKKLVGFLPRTRRALNHTWWANFFAAWGGDWFTADWQPRIAQPQAVASLEFALKLLDYGPPNAADLGFVEVNRGWVEGDAALSMHYQTMGTTAQFDKAASKVVDKVAVAQLPSGPAGRRAALVGGQVLGIPAKSKNPEAAYLMARWLVNTENIKRTSLQGTGVEPVWSSVFQDPEFQRGFTDGKAGWRAELDQANAKTLALPNIPEWPQLQEALDLNLSQAYVKQKSPGDALQETASAWLAVLGRAGYYRGVGQPYRTQG